MIHMKAKKTKGWVKKMEGHEYPPAEVEAAGSRILREPEAAYVVQKVREGLPFDEFHSMQEMLGVTEEKMGALVGMSRATLHRRKKTGFLDRSESDKLVRYARVFKTVRDFCEDSESAARWLNSPAMAFNYETPLDYADTEIGAREVEALIMRLEYGIAV
jgi:putative toxin-antitoxin system antitoxin component (TIGR02293 family)